MAICKGVVKGKVQMNIALGVYFSQQPMKYLEMYLK